MFAVIFKNTEGSFSAYVLKSSVSGKDLWYFFDKHIVREASALEIKDDLTNPYFLFYKRKYAKLSDDPNHVNTRNKMIPDEEMKTDRRKEYYKKL